MNSQSLALVTGGASGIGRAIVERLAEDGFHVVIVDLNRAARGRGRSLLAGEGIEPPRRSVLDITDEAAVRWLVAELPPLDRSREQRRRVQGPALRELHGLRISGGPTRST